MDYSGSFAQEWQNEEKEDNNQKEEKNDTVVLIVYTVRVYKKGVNIDKTNYFSYFHRVF